MHTHSEVRRPSGEEAVTTTMSQQVNTRLVTGRRPVRYALFRDLIGDVHRLSALPHRQLGNWSLGQIVDHLQRALLLQVESTPVAIPFWERIAARLAKRRLLSRSLKAGCLPPMALREQLAPRDGVEVAAAVRELEQAIARCRDAQSTQPHPLLGRISRAEWEQYHLRHAELHMSFLVTRRA
ncbi:MAG: DUF1569 domain-containing protein [Planctomycetales bacterium]|nr:DUF1569 domain-containing protein [Planctomycetales bacterium]